MPIFYADNFCTCEESTVKGEKFYVFTGCFVGTKRVHSVTVPAKALEEYRQGAYIQNAFSMLSDDDREFLMTGISPESWDAKFKEEEPDDDEEEDEDEEPDIEYNSPIRHEDDEFKRRQDRRRNLPGIHDDEDLQ